MSIRTIAGLRSMQAAPLEVKLVMTQRRIMQWVDEWGEDGVYVSFSGGKDSTVLLDIARKMFPNLKAMFVDIPTQYPELKQFVQTFDNVDITKPKINFFQVCEKYGLPMISKEISNSVYEARKFIEKLKHRQTDRQTDRDSLFVGHGGYSRNTAPDEKQGQRRISKAEEGTYP